MSEFRKISANNPLKAVNQSFVYAVGFVELPALAIRIHIIRSHKKNSPA
jgi:hypothetical protein